MDGYQFTAAMVSHLAWPAVALIAIVILRKPLLRRLEHLRSVKAGSFAAEFGEAERRVEQAIEAEADRAEANESTETASAPSSAEIGRLEGGFQKIALQASQNPSYSVVASWSLLNEIMASAAADVTPTKSRPISAPSVSLISTLREQGVISEQTFAALDSLRRLRNEVAHGKTAPETGAALAYVSSVNDIAEIVRSGVDAVWRRRQHA